MKVEPLNIELEGWGINAIGVTLVSLQQKEHERT
jgi:hypothetical protein